MTQKPLTFTQAYEACLALTREAFPTLKGHSVVLIATCSSYHSYLAHTEHQRTLEFQLVVCGTKPKVDSISGVTLDEIVTAYEQMLSRYGLIIRNGERMASIDI